MALDLKHLKKLAEACRKAGIRHFKCGNLEFTLTEDAPSKRKRLPAKSSSSKPISEVNETTFSVEQEDAISDEDLLMWSAANGGLSVREQVEASLPGN